MGEKAKAINIGMGGKTNGTQKKGTRRVNMCQQQVQGTKDANAAC